MHVISIDFYIMVKTIVRAACYTQGRIIFEVLRYMLIEFVQFIQNNLSNNRQ